MTSPQAVPSPIALEIPAEPAPLEFQPERVDELPDDVLDRLPFGAICVDRAGRILRYNIAESRFARLDRNTVLGRDFFGEVAPCTRTAAYEGRFRAFLVAGHLTERFHYLFDFKFGAQEVEVELVRARGGERIYMLLNRRRILPRRPDVDPKTLAPRQVDLAPDEGPRGVVRDDRDVRQIGTSPALWEAMRVTWDRVAPKGWPLFTEEWGLQWGRLAVVALEAQVIEDGRGSLKEVPIREAIDYVASDLRRLGWGELRADFSAASDGLFVLEVSRNALAESVGFSEVPRCHLVAGYLRGVFAHLAEKHLAIREVSCGAQGHPRCSFLVASRNRRAELDAACATAEDDVARVISAFANEVRRAR